ncbi:MAG: hypothetical protein WCP96_11900 [Methylococcaceae bacterium]
MSEGVGDMPRVNIFICDVESGNRDHIGYTCNDKEVYRNLNETTDELMKHLKGSVVDSDLTGVHAFMVGALK